MVDTVGTSTWRTDGQTVKQQTARCTFALYMRSDRFVVDLLFTPCRVKIPRRKVWLTRTARVPCSNAANIGERARLGRSEFCTWQNFVTGQEPPKMNI